MSQDIDPEWYRFRDMVYSKEFEKADEMLRARPALLHLMSGIGETVMHFLAVENDEEGVAWLYAKGADLNAKNVFGEPALFEVASLEYKGLFEWFVKMGADIHAKDHDDRDVVLHLLAFGKDEMAEWVRRLLVRTASLPR
jgi:ankyrin repeat protein